MNPSAGLSDAATLHLVIILGRTLQFGSGMLLVNLAAFRWLILGPVAADSKAAGSPMRSLLRRFDLAFAACAGLLVVSGVLLFLGAAADMSGVPLAEACNRGLLTTVLLQTDFGCVAQFRLLLVLLLAVVMAKTLWSRDARRSGGTEMATAFLAGAIFISIAWTGHAASIRHGISWPLLADAVHLAAVSIWPGGLLPFAYFLGYMAKTGSAHLPFTLPSVRRFSVLSLGAVGLLALTGAINSFFLVKTFANLFTTSYGRLLSLKLLLFTLMLAVASWNRQVLLPRLLAGGTSRCPDSPAAPTRLIRSLRFFVLVEAGLALAVLIVVAVLGITPPPEPPAAK